MKKVGKGRKPLKGLDNKDLEIMGALSTLGGKVSTEELATIAKYAPRTIRYRLKRLKDEGYLAQLFAQTHEIKLGMGDCMLILEENHDRSQELKEVINSIPWFYYHGPTYGRYNGYMIHAMLSTDELDGITRLADELVSLGLARDYYYYYMTDYESRRGDFKYFEYNKGWNWDWAQWIREAEGCISTGDAITFNMEYEPAPIDFDEKDVILLTELKRESNRTLKEFGEIIDLSETQVKRRITRLEEANIIKGYRWIIRKIEQPLYIYLYMDIPDDVECILSAFYRLPFPAEITMESRHRYCARIRLYGTEITGLLRGITHMRKYLDSYFVQIVHDITDAPLESPTTYFVKDDLRWEYPTDEAIKRIRKKYG